MDLVLTVPVFIILSPLLVCISLLLWIVEGRPVLFLQKRPGYLGEIFSIYKFRTMKETRDANGALLPDDQRTTHLGKFLRETSLDEFPELINVLIGDMSLVGPRPLLVQYLDRYSPEQARRHLVYPGITGLAQVNGRNMVNWEERFAMDVWYVDHWSLKLDIKILVKTIGKVLAREAISPQDKLTPDEFRGNEDKQPAKID